MRRIDWTTHFNFMPVGLKAGLMVLALACGMSGTWAAEPRPPAIAITFQHDRSASLIPLLKEQYQRCVNTKRAYQGIKAEGIAWEAASRDLPPGYDVDGALSPEPDWERSGIGVSREEEYFDGARYAHYVFLPRYSFSNDGRCRLQRGGSAKIELDDGERTYYIELSNPASENIGTWHAGPELYGLFGKRTVRHAVSQAQLQRQVQQELMGLRGNENVARMIGAMMSGATRRMMQGPANGRTSSDADRMREALNLHVDPAARTALPDSSDQHVVAGQPCDVVSSGAMGGRTWYWHRMHYYPGPLKRPIILKTETRFGNSVSVKKAVSFTLSDHLDNRFFTPPRNLSAR